MLLTNNNETFGICWEILTQLIFDIDQFVSPKLPTFLLGDNCFYLHTIEMVYLNSVDFTIEIIVYIFRLCTANMNADFLRLEHSVSDYFRADPVQLHTY